MGKLKSLCKKITDKVSEEMIQGVETIGDYGFKCAVEGFEAGIEFALEINNQSRYGNEDVGLEIEDKVAQFKDV